LKAYYVGFLLKLFRDSYIFFLKYPSHLFIFLWRYELLWIVGLLMGVGQILGAYLGSKLVLKTNGKFIKTLFLIVVGATIIKVAWDYFS
ncbi:hypothetical protein ACLJCC_08835, partial [Campylobacter coli]